MSHLSKDCYTLSETLLEKLEGINILVCEDKKLINNLAIFSFESLCVPTNELKTTQSTTSIIKHIPISVSLSSNLTNKNFSLLNKDPQKLIINFVSTLKFWLRKVSSKLDPSFKMTKQ